MKKSLLNLLLILLSLFISLVFIELFLHIVKPAVAYQNLPQKIIQDFLDSSETTEFTLKKNYSGQFLMSGASFDSTVKTNKLGWRDTEPDNREKVLVFGDSFIFGFGVNNNETIPFYLEQKQPKYDFVNLGYVAGRSPDSYANYLKHNKSLQQKNTIVVIYHNDLKDMTNNICLDRNNTKVVLNNNNCKNIKSKFDSIHDGKIISNNDYKRKLYDLNLGWCYTLLKQSYILGILKDRLSRKTHPELAALTTAKNTLTQYQQNKIKDSINILKENSKSLTVFMIENNADSIFYSFINKYCREIKINCHPIPRFEKKYYWKNDGHYNKNGTEKASKIILSHLDF